MAEEVQNADVIVPWSMVFTTILNGAFGFAMVIAVLFVTVDIESALESPTGSLGYPYMDIFLTATNSHAGASVMISILITITICATVAFVATTSRLIWAFARDRGFPGWQYVKKVRHHYQNSLAYQARVCADTNLVGPTNQHRPPPCRGHRPRPLHPHRSH